MGRKKDSKGLIFVVIILLVIFFIYYKFIYLSDFIPKLEVMEDNASVSEYYIYGSNLNIKGSISNIDTNYDAIDLVLYNGDFYDYDIDVIKGEGDISFEISSLINDGMYLENIDVGKYYLFIRVTYKNEDNENEYNYYVLDNKTDYSENVYYTFSGTNRKIVINSSNDYATMMFNVSNNSDDNVYDIVIDPGHGGVDSGAVSSNEEYVESDITMKISRYIYDNLVSKGVKVKLTREEDTLDDDEYFEEYNVKDVGYIGRAVIPNEVNAKYVFSIHLNSLESSRTRGLEIYTANMINYDFIEGVINKVINNTEMVVSSKNTYRISDGVYTRNFTDNDVTESLEGYDKKGYNRYNVTTSSNYFYMIRETGGFMTGAYVDDGNEKVGENPYYNSNKGTETYLMEIGYLSNSRDLNYIINNMEEYADVIADAIYEGIFEGND